MMEFEFSCVKDFPEIVSRFARAVGVHVGTFLQPDTVITYGCNDEGQQLKMSTANGESSVVAFVPDRHDEKFIVITSYYDEGLLQEFNSEGTIIQKQGGWFGSKDGEREFAVYDGVTYTESDPLQVSVTRQELRQLIQHIIPVVR